MDSGRQEHPRRRSLLPPATVVSEADFLANVGGVRTITVSEADFFANVDGVRERRITVEELEAMEPAGLC